MTLENFFALTETKDGFTAPSRVNELFTEIQKGNDCIVKNVGDAARQWCTVAKIIAATKNRDCLDLFIQLEGLSFINQWLKDAQDCGTDTSDNCVEESITAFLQALEQLRVGNEKAISSGIWMTVKNLLSHKSSKVQDRAKTLFESWKPEHDISTLSQDVEESTAICGDRVAVETELLGYPGKDVSPSRGCSDEEIHVDPDRDKMNQAVILEAEPEKVDEQIELSRETTDHSTNKDVASDPVSSPVTLEPSKENLVFKEEYITSHSGETTVVDSCDLVAAQRSIIEGSADVNKCMKDLKHNHNIDNFPDKLSQVECSRASSHLEPKTISSSAYAANDAESLIEESLQNCTDVKGEDFNPKASSSSDVKAVLSVGKSETEDIGSSPNQHGSARMFRNIHQDFDRENDVLSGSSGSKCILGKSENADSDEGGELASNSKPVIDANNSDFINRSSSNIDLDNDMVDAIEIEKEVVDRRETSCSTSDKILEGEIRQPDSIGSIDGKEFTKFCAEVQQEEDPVINVVNLNNEPENCIQDLNSSQVMGMTREPEDRENDLCTFDLNQEICSEDMDLLGNAFATPVSVVSASSRASAAAAPLHFEGALGWNASAGTSAFRPSSPPRRSSEGGGDKILSLGGCSSSGSKQHQQFNCLNFDLNVAESGDGKVTDLEFGKPINVIRGFPRGESSMEERPKLDLNCTNDDDGDFHLDKHFFQHLNRSHQSPSPSSSSPSMQPPPQILRNIDLNDQPHYPTNSLFPSLNVPGALKSDDSVISLMGTRVEIKRNGFVPQTPLLQNGRILEPALGLNLSQTGGLFGIGSSAVSYNSLRAGPTTMSLGSSGPIHYMVDPRETQVMGSASSSVQPCFSPPQFIPSAGGGGTFPSSSNGGVGPSREYFDLNSGLMIEGGNRGDESGSLRRQQQQQLLIPGQVVESSSSSGGGGEGGKRKEPDGGWEPYPSNYKHSQSPWK